MGNGVRAGVVAAVALCAFGFAGRARADPPVGFNSASLNKNYASGSTYRYPQANFFGRIIDGKKGAGFAEGAFATAREGNIMLTAGGSLEQAKKGSDPKNPASDGKQGIMLYAGVEKKVERVGSIAFIGGANSTWTTPATKTTNATLLPEAALVLDASGAIPVVAVGGVTPKYSYTMANVGIARWLVASVRTEFLSNSTNWTGGADYVLKYSEKPGNDVFFFASASTNTKDGGLIFNGGARVRRVFSSTQNVKPYYIEANAGHDAKTGTTTYTLMVSVPLQ